MDQQQRLGGRASQIQSQGAVVRALRGQTLRVPNLKAVFGGWPAAQQNPLYASVAQPAVTEVIDRVAASQPTAAGRREDDIALLVSLWYPDIKGGSRGHGTGGGDSDTDFDTDSDGEAAAAVLRNLAAFAVWLVCWDDEVDADDGGDLAGDFARAESWRQRTLTVLERALSRDEDGEEEEELDALNGVLVDWPATRPRA
jgi:hypothetical protein